MTPPAATSVLPAGCIVPPAGQVVGWVKLTLHMGGRRHIETDIQDPAILIGMLRRCADAIERQGNAGPGTAIIDHRKATFHEDAGKPGSL